MSIPFTQYLLPDGRQVPNQIDMPDEVEKKAHELISVGCKFNIEMLTTGEIAMYCENDNWIPDNPVVSVEVCANGPEVVASVERLVSKAYDAYQYIKSQVDTQ